jgi:predicted nucleotidyltransferase
MKNHSIPLESRIAGIFDCRREQLTGYQVWLFGSRGRGTPRSNSDYDVGILGEKPLDLPTYFEIQDAMEALPTLHAIDWVDLNRATKGLRENALKEGKLLYEG